MTFADINQKIHDEEGYYVSQTTGTERRLGDVGYYTEDDGFTRRSTLDNLGVQFETREDEHRTDYTFKSEQGVKQSVSAAGEPAGVFKSITEAEAGVRFDFSSEGSAVISIKGAREHSINNKNAVAVALKEAEIDYPNLNNAIVSRVMLAESSTVLISDSSEATVELRANASVELADFSIGDLDADFEVGYSENMMSREIGEAGGAPLYDLTTLKESADLGVIPSIFSLSLFDSPPEIAAQSQTASGEKLTQSEAEELLRPVRPSELTNADTHS